MRLRIKLCLVAEDDGVEADGCKVRMSGWWRWILEVDGSRFACE